MVVKNEKGKISDRATVTISNIDMECPVIKLTDPLYVQKMTVAALWKWAGHEGNSGGRNMN